jgi:hypothetical protein
MLPTAPRPGHAVGYVPRSKIATLALRPCCSRPLHERGPIATGRLHPMLRPAPKDAPTARGLTSQRATACNQPRMRTRTRGVPSTAGQGVVVRRQRSGSSGSCGWGSLTFSLLAGADPGPIAEMHEMNTPDKTPRTSCECGCGGTPKGFKSRYLPGHDARHAAAQRADASEATRETTRRKTHRSPSRARAGHGRQSEAVRSESEEASRAEGAR